MSKIIGYRKFSGKKKQPLCIISILRPYTDRQIDLGACGDQIEEIFVPADQHDLIVPSVVGCGVDIFYRVENGRAYVDHIVIGE